MDDEHNQNESRHKMHPRGVSNDISVSLASLLKSFSESSVVGGQCELPMVTPELTLDIETFERNLLLHKQVSSGDHIQGMKYINDKRSKSQFDSDINKSVRDDTKGSSGFINSHLLTNVDSLNSIQMHNISALKSLFNNQNGQIYLLVKGDNVQTLDGSSNLTGIFDSNNYSHNIQLSSDPGDDLSPQENCNNNNPSLMMAAQQLHMSSNLTTAELIQKLLESPQCPNNQIESVIGDHKLSDDSIPSLSSNFTRQPIRTADNITNYYTCSVDSNNEADVTLLVDDESSQSSQQFVVTNNKSTKSDKQILFLNSNLKLESRQSTDELIDNSVKNNFNSLLNDHRSDSLDLNNDISHNVVQSNSISPFVITPIVINESESNKKRHKRIKTKPLKNIEVNDFIDCGLKSHSPNSPIFPKPISQVEDDSPKEILNDNDEIKELKRKSSHNEVSMSQVEDDSPKEILNGNGEIKELKRKSSHNEVERRRRDRINTWISELQNMLPNSEKMQLNRSKSHVLKAVYDFFRGQTDQFTDLKVKHEKLEIDNREKVAIIKKLETEKEVLLNQLQYINQAVTSTVKSTQESMNRGTVNQFRINSVEEVNQPYKITNIYSKSNETNSFSPGFIVDNNNQNKKRKINNGDTDQ